MGLFSKKKGVKDMKESTLPELPEPKPFDNLFLSKEDLPDIPGEFSKIEKNSLISAPIESKTKFTQDVIKKEIEKPDLENTKQELAPEAIEIKSPIKSDWSSKPLIRKTQPIYIRLDKFENTLSIFDDIKGKIQEIEDLLKRVQEIKQREEQELNEWQRNLQLIKSRLEYIDKSIFDQID